jgi:prolyl oligopeptidase
MNTPRIAPLAAAITVLMGLAACETTPTQKPVQVATPAPTPVAAPEVRAPGKFPAGQVAAVRVVTDTYHGTPVADPYRYMENTRDAEVAGWFKSQADATRKTLDRIPGRADLLKRIAELSEGSPNAYNMQQRGGRVFHMKTEATSPVARLVTRDSIGSAPRVLIDPLAGHTGKPRSIDWYKASPDGRMVAYGMSEGGSENSVLRVMDTATGRDMGVAIERVVLDVE